MRVLLAALGAFVAYFAAGGLMFVTMPWMKKEFEKYPAVYRPSEGQMKNMPVAMAATSVAIVVLAVLYAMIYHGGSGVVAGAQFGAQFGALIGVFAIGAFTVHNFVNLNIGWKLTVEQSVAYFVEWLVVGIVIGVIYRPR
jgi:hypothetical protein